MLLPMGNPGFDPDYPKYLDQFLMVLLETFTTGHVFAIHFNFMQFLAKKVK